MEPHPLAFCFLPPIYCPDGRVYDLLEIGIYEHEGEQWKWTLEMNAQARSCCTIFFFKILIYPRCSVCHCLHSSHCDGWDVVSERGRDFVLDYLKFHPEPERVYPRGGPIIIDFI